jgi:hypothetical protein
MITTFRQKLAEIEAEMPNSKLAQTLTVLKSKLERKPLILYGAGDLGGKMLDLCKEYGLVVTCSCDRSVKGMLNGEVKIIDPQTLQREFPNAVIIICSFTYNDEISDTLTKLGFTSDQIIPCLIQYPYWFLGKQQFDIYTSGNEWAYDFFEDERSKQLVLDRIRMYLTNCPLVPNTQCDRYYEENFMALRYFKWVRQNRG